MILEGFDEPLRKDRTRNGGGILVYLSNLLKYNRRHDLESPIIKKIWVELNSDITLLLCCLYKSDFNALQSLLINEIQNSIEIALDYTSHIILTRDINIDFLNLTNSQMKDCLTIFSLRNVLNEPTRVTISSSTFIDAVIVSDACTVLDSGTMDVDEFISDHKATYIAIQISIKISTSYYREV